MTELDRYLEANNMWRKHIAKDGSCLFRAVSEQVIWLKLCIEYIIVMLFIHQVYSSQVEHLQVRQECIDYIRENQAKFKEVKE